MLLTATILINCSHRTQPPVAVCVWRGGDDGLTVRLADKLEQTIRATPPLMLGSCRLHGEPTITLPHVAWEKEKESVHVTARFIISGLHLSQPMAMEARCADDRLSDCATEIVNRSLSVWRLQARTRR